MSDEESDRRNMPKPSMTSQVKSGFRLALTILFFIGIAGLFFVGAAYVLLPSGRSKIVGWLFLLLSSAVMVWMMDRWVKALPGILIYGSFGGLLATLSGHLVNRSSAQIPRIYALTVTVLLAASAAVALTLDRRKLRLTDRLALMAFAFTLAFGAAVDSQKLQMAGKGGSHHFAGVLALFIAFCFLFLAWAYDRILRRQRVEDPH